MHWANSITCTHNIRVDKDVKLGAFFIPVLGVFLSLVGKLGNIFDLVLFGLLKYFKLFIQTDFVYTITSRAYTIIL